jgi:hypothetical protein
MAFLGGHQEVTYHLEVFTKNEAPVALEFSGKIFVGLWKLVYLYQASFLKEVRMDQGHAVA